MATTTRTGGSYGWAACEPPAAAARPGADAPATAPDGAGPGLLHPDQANEQLADRLTAEVTDPHQRRDDTVQLPARYEGPGDLKAPRSASLHIRQRDLRGVKAARSFVHEQLTSGTGRR
ncbi:hypothetical protein WKI68_44790 [Streptomyces sp. MS1.HAVA.3]|uniref:Uncharacterized protein n=1 Tax=Streptomyces caledonius TaxID=3134107 RepID=A0ABU8UF15_9ACTN